MSNSGLAALDAVIHAQLLGAGIADTCTFAPVSGLTIAGASCIVDRNQAALAMRGVEFRSDAMTVTLFRAGISQRPREGDAIIVGADTFRVRSMVEADDSRWLLECGP